jgi:antitoxin VapB
LKIVTDAGRAFNVKATAQLVVDKSQEITAKTARVVEMLLQNNLGGVLISSQPNFSWLTAGSSNGIDMSREAGAGALLVRDDGKRFVLANRIEMPRLVDEELADEGFEPVEFSWEAEKASPGFLATQALGLLSKGATLGSDVDAGPAALPVEASLARCRFQLTTAELERFRMLASEAAQAVGKLARTLTPGETEREVARRLADVLAVHNIRAVVNLVAADERIQKYRHPVPTDRRWEKVLMMVVCARRGGMIASFTRIVCSGAIPDELQRHTLAAARVNAQLLAATRPGVSGADLFKLAADTYANEGFAGEEHLHHQGGATGYRTRDWLAYPACTERVQTNQLFAWNPSVTGTKVEETCISSADGAEVLTTTPAWPQLPFVVEGREYFSPNVLSL